jgi:hypothetical protein
LGIKSETPEIPLKKIKFLAARENFLTYINPLVETTYL